VVLCAAVWGTMAVLGEMVNILRDKIGQVSIPGSVPYYNAQTVSFLLTLKAVGFLQFKKVFDIGLESKGTRM
jgi:hypothetical protein